MEDHNQSWKKSKSAEKDSILELSTDMESPDQTKHKIIDLTLEMDTAEDTAKTPPEKERIKENLSESPEPAEEKNPTETVSEAADIIENEVDAAFDEAQMESQEATATKADDELFDELSDITQQVDDAVSQLKPDTSQDENPLSIIDPGPLDNETVAADAAELEVAMAGDYQDDPAPPTDVDSNEDDDLSHAFEVSTEDDIIELVDVVDSVELAALDSPSEKDDDIIELTDIVDPAEAESLGIGIQQEEEVPEADDIPDPTDAIESAEMPYPSVVESEDRLEEALSLSEAEDDFDLSADIDAELLLDSTDIAESEVPAEEEALTLSEADDDFDLPVDIDAELSMPEAPFDPDEIDNLFEDDIIAQEETELAIEPQVEDIATDDAPAAIEESGHHEQVIQLADVLRASSEQPSQEAEIQTDAEPEPAHQLSAVASQDTSGALDSDLDQASEIDEASDEDKKIEAAVEHVIQTKYADTIEQLIANEVEKAVTREIENIKRTLADDGDAPL